MCVCVCVYMYNTLSPCPPLLAGSHAQPLPVTTHADVVLLPSGQAQSVHEPTLLLHVGVYIDGIQFTFYSYS